MYKSVIFDVDGTLLNSDQAIILALQKVLQEEMDIEYPSEKLTYLLGMTSVNSLRMLEISNVERANEKLLHYLGVYHNLLSIYSGIEKMLEKLVENKIHTGIVTSKTREEFKADFIPFGLLKYFSHVICADDTAKHKPEPDPLLKYMEQTGVNPKTAIYIGDTVFDQICANEAKIDFGLALWGAKQPEAISATHRLDHPEDIYRFMHLIQHCGSRGDLI